MITAFSGTSSDRNTTIISRKDTSSTARKKYGIRELSRLEKSTVAGTCPVTATSLPSAASPSTSTSSRSRCTSSVVASSCGEVSGMMNHR